MRLRAGDGLPGSRGADREVGGRTSGRMRIVKGVTLPLAGADLLPAFRLSVDLGT